MGGEKARQGSGLYLILGSPPHGRGKAAPVVRAGVFSCGSPPRGRGKVISALSLVNWSRITPAWAGKSCFSRFKMPQRGDHPRVGGEKTLPAGVMVHVPGSPPRGRGKAHLLNKIFPAIRITPAWAGKSLCVLSPHPLGQDHPRVGGEKPNRILWTEFRQGSPPRGRGKEVSYFLCC